MMGWGETLLKVSGSTHLQLLSCRSQGQKYDLKPARNSLDLIILRFDGASLECEFAHASDWLLQLPRIEGGPSNRDSPSVAMSIKRPHIYRVQAPSHSPS
jgi:hypothetical protein